MTTQTATRETLEALASELFGYVDYANKSAATRGEDNELAYGEAKRLVLANIEAGLGDDEAREAAAAHLRGWADSYRADVARAMRARATKSDLRSGASAVMALEDNALVASFVWDVDLD